MRVAARYFTWDITKTLMNIVLRYSWHVMLYKWYLEHNQSASTEDYGHWAEPLILDSDDLMYNKAAVAELCRKTALDPDRVQYHWAKTAAESTYEKEEVFTDTLTASEAILPGKSSVNLRLEEELEKWLVEFGEERGQLLRDLVADAMPDYQYLRERSIGATHGAVVDSGQH
ncbi:Pyrrolopyrazine biosynthesis cluster protein F [Fulvia fulva]|nr:Pyrrolopyrazine biosynthesis cluster protein F [Fulvia fulva]WPV15335.1 Pyrrolopyrazine biosynthesis cluster protein F [Fulvia fulva]WPV29945.1 Pyrrolopyrazine biosynthesis cluster protein F [Fulvia fulva]